MPTTRLPPTGRTARASRVPFPSRTPVTPSPRPDGADARSRPQFILSRLRQSPVLRVCAGLAFLEYGALAIWAVFGRSASPQAPRLGTWFMMASWLAFCSLASWFFLFLWYPALQLMQGAESGDDAGIRVSRVLEIFAVSCVAAVHGMLAWILVSAA